MSAIQKAESELLLDRYHAIRQQSVDLCAPLATEDYQVQPMDDASPPKWHLAHITWFFETFILKDQIKNYEPYDARFEVLFNSYYNGVGQPYPRVKRGHLSRPTIEEIVDYRRAVDSMMAELLSTELSEVIRFKVELGLNHEQQHQELLLTDIKYNLGNNPLKPKYLDVARLDATPASLVKWHEFSGGLIEIGARNNSWFVFDNETPRHKVFLEPFKLATRAVSNGEYLAFMEDDGYKRHELWLSDGWTHLSSLKKRWDSPLYWRRDGNAWLEYNLTGEREVDPQAPLCHVSGYEADAFARWAGARLPSEMEWEAAVATLPLSGNFLESKYYQPTVQCGKGLVGFFGDVWEWTSTGYGPYPGFKPFAGALGEYNGKFMANQLVLRGGSCATPSSHIRPTYRNFFYPKDRWQFSGLRLAQDI